MHDMPLTCTRGEHVLADQLSCRSIANILVVCLPCIPIPVMVSHKLNDRIATDSLDSPSRYIPHMVISR